MKFISQGGFVHQTFWQLPPASFGVRSTTDTTNSDLAGQASSKSSYFPVPHLLFHTSLPHPPSRGPLPGYSSTELSSVEPLEWPPIHNTPHKHYEGSQLQSKSASMNQLSLTASMMYCSSSSPALETEGEHYIYNLRDCHLHRIQQKQKRR